MNADRLAGFDGADIADVRFHAHDFAEMNAGRTAMGDEFAEPHMPRQAGNRIVPGGDGADMTAMRHRELRIGIMPGKARQLRELR
ncbi:hypothetical protein D3C78_721020 [compost metagenome]